MTGPNDGVMGAAKCLVILFVSLGSHACGEIGADYRYKGAYRVAEGVFEVRSVFNAIDSPVILASHHDAAQEGAPEELWMLRLNGEQSCSVGETNGYLASADERGFRLALFAPADGLSFFTETCKRVELDLSGVEYLQLVAREGLYVYLGEGFEDELIVVDPFEATRRTLARGVKQAYGSRLVPEGGAGVARWLVGVDGGLRLQGLQGDAIDSELSGVRELLVRPGASVAGAPLEYLIVIGESGVALYRAALVGTELEVVEIWSRESVCAPRVFEHSMTDCVSARCKTAAAPVVVEGVPWVSVESPCGSGKLLLVSGDNAVEAGWAGAATDYRFFPDVRGGGPWLLYNVVGESGLTTFQVPVGEEFADEPPRPLINSLVLDSIKFDPTNAAYTAMTAEVPGRYGTWVPGGTFLSLISDVETSRNGLILHHVQNEAGLLSYCRAGVCQEVAQGVPREQSKLYASVPRFDESEPVVAFVGDFDAETQTGTLGVFFPQAKVRVELADGVTSFEPVENGAVRGIAYTVGTEGAEGLWFAPR